MLKVYFTVDVETSMGGAWSNPALSPLPSKRRVFCPIGSESYGITRMAELLGRYGFQGTFFVETLATQVLGEEDIRPIFDALLSTGQDVQLHAHPNFHFYARYLKARERGEAFDRNGMSDRIGELPPEVQAEILEEAVSHFVRFAGFRPTVYRAGSFAANRATLRALSQLGFRLDSSFSPCYRQTVSFPGERVPVNRASRLEDLWELPVTVARSPLPEGPEGFKMADVSTISNAEIEHLLEDGARRGLRHAVLLFHSFSLVKSRDVSYSQMRPDRLVLRRLERLFEWLARRPDRFEVSTLGRLAGNTAELTEETAEPLPTLPLTPAVARKFAQAVNRLYWF